MQVIPSIIGRDFGEVEERVNAVEDLVDWVQLDVSDGDFAPAESWPYYESKEYPRDIQELDFIRSNELQVEAHLMVRHPERVVERWIDAGVDRVLVHYESTDEATLAEIMEALETDEVEAGLVLNYETPVEVVDKFVDKLDVVQLMSIAKLGSYGQPFEEGVYDKIKSLRAKYPGLTIAVDGGVNLENAPRLISAGADNLVVGSAIQGSVNIPETIAKFKSLR